MRRITRLTFALVLSGASLALAGHLTTASALKCHCNPASAGTCGLLPGDTGQTCQPGGCTVSGNFTGRCKASGGGGGGSVGRGPENFAIEDQQQFTKPRGKLFKAK